MSKSTYWRFAIGVMFSVVCGSAAATAVKAEHYAELVIQGKQAAQHQLHEDAEILWQLMAPRLASLPAIEQAQWWLAQADLLQFEHRFAEALTALEQVLALQQLHEPVYLMQARIALTRDDLARATQACRALTGYSQIDVVATCLLEVQGRAGQLESSYTRLQQLHLRNSNSTEALQQWRLQILAEQAHLLGRYNEALEWLDYPNYFQQPEVMQRQMLDILLQTGRAAEVLALSGVCPKVDALPSDSLLVRVAYAEAQLGEQQCWREVTAQRMHLRELRADALHTADIAYYFSYVAPDGEKARYWAKQNMAVAQEPFDKQLLAAAQELAL
ncbi:hypothetical protein [Alishewanella sp. HL-SH05]|uniref:hypothetical protein n=1 Tax=Alishewanella sp. HL-SH05 TaxID=3461145 RepID=UPI0040425D8A